MILQRVFYNTFHLVQKTFHLDASLVQIQQCPSIEALPHPVATRACGSRSRVALRVGNKGTIGIWKPFSTIYIYISHEFGKDYTYVQTKTQEAVDAWNKTILDRTTDRRPWFELTESTGEATCIVGRQLSPGDPGQVAEAFFPEDQERDIWLFPEAFKRHTRPYLGNFLLHELAHVQGARHYFSDEEDDDDEHCTRAATIGPDDPSSVTNYAVLPEVPRLQDSDVEGMKKLYSLDGDSYMDHKVVYIEAKPMGLSTVQTMEPTDSTCSNIHAERSYEAETNFDSTGANKTDMAIMCILAALLFILFYRISTR